MVEHYKLHKEAQNISKKEVLKGIIWILFILLIFYFSIRLIGTDDIQDKVQAAGIFGPLILIFIKASTIVFAPLGGIPIYIVSGTLFGFTKGFIYILIGDFIGFTTSFYISRIFGRKVATYFLSKQGMSAAKDVLHHMGTTKGLYQTCLVFIGFPEAVSYGAGLTKISYIKFISILMSVWIFPIIALVFLGNSITKNFGSSSILVINAVVILIILLGIFWLHKQSQKNKN